MVGAKCDKDKEIFIGLQSKAGLGTYDYGPWGKTFTCSGDWEDFRLVWDELQPSYGSAPGEFDPSALVRLSIMYSSNTHPSEIQVTLAGVGLDSSIIQYRQEDIENYKPEVAASIQKAQQQSWNIQSSITPSQWSFQSIPSQLIGMDAKFNLYTLNGRLVESHQFEIGFHNQGFFQEVLSSQTYYMQLTVANTPIWVESIRL